MCGCEGQGSTVDTRSLVACKYLRLLPCNTLEDQVEEVQCNDTRCTYDIAVWRWFLFSFRPSPSYPLCHSSTHLTTRLTLHHSFPRIGIECDFALSIVANTHCWLFPFPDLSFFSFFPFPSRRTNIGPANSPLTTHTTDTAVGCRALVTYPTTTFSDAQHPTPTFSAAPETGLA